MDVVELLRQEISNKEIGEMLDISENTVNSHVKNLFAKEHVVSRTEAVYVALQRGLIEL